MCFRHNQRDVGEGGAKEGWAQAGALQHAMNRPILARACKVGVHRFAGASGFATAAEAAEAAEEAAEEEELLQCCWAASEPMQPTPLLLCAEEGGRVTPCSAEPFCRPPPHA